MTWQARIQRAGCPVKPGRGCHRFLTSSLLLLPLLWGCFTVEGALGIPGSYRRKNERGERRTGEGEVRRERGGLSLPFRAERDRGRRLQRGLVTEGLAHQGTDTQAHLPSWNGNLRKRHSRHSRKPHNYFRQGSEMTRRSLSWRLKPFTSERNSRRLKSPRPLHPRNREYPSEGSEEGLMGAHGKSSRLPLDLAGTKTGGMSFRRLEAEGEMASTQQESPLHTTDLPILAERQGVADLGGSQVIRGDAKPSETASLSEQPAHLRNALATTTREETLGAQTEAMGRDTLGTEATGAEVLGTETSEKGSNAVAASDQAPRTHRKPSTVPVLVSDQPPKSKNAYASILYMGTARDYEYYIGLRVTLQTVKRAGTTGDLVALVSPGTPHSWQRALARDGVRVVRSPNLDNPYNGTAQYNARFRFVLNKLAAWLLVEYSRVVLLDADNLVLKGMDELFLCGDFCAVFLNPCIPHTGLVVLKPSKRTFRDMAHQLASLPSYDAADQGFLASYFPTLLASPLFEPPTGGGGATPRSSALDPGKGPRDAEGAPRPLRGLYRLPMGYQMDAIYYYLKSAWNVPCSENKVITFPGSSALKPWYWWSWPVFSLAYQWHAERLATVGYAWESAVCTAWACLWALVLLATHPHLKQGLSFLLSFPLPSIPLGSFPLSFLRRRSWVENLKAQNSPTGHSLNGAAGRQPGAGLNQAGWGAGQAGEGAGLFPEHANGNGGLPLSSPVGGGSPQGLKPKPRNGFHLLQLFPGIGIGAGSSSDPSAIAARAPRPRPRTPVSIVCTRVLSVACIFIAGAVAYATVPSTAHPFAGWPLFFMGTLTLLRLTRIALSAPAAVYWLPAYTAVSMSILGLPIYSALAFRLVAFCILSFGGGVVLVLVVQSMWLPPEHSWDANGEDGYHPRTE